MRKVTLLLSFAIVSNCLFAQKNFQPGYIINNSGQKIEGFIDYRKWDRNPDKISFMVTMEGEPITYSPLDIKSFYVKDEMSYYLKDEMYISAIVDIDKSPYSISELTQDFNGKFEKEVVFLSLYIQGAYNLYYYKDENKKIHYFINNQGNEIEELIFRKYLKIIEGNSKVMKYEQYKEKLMDYLQDDPSIITMINKTSYNTKPLIDLIEKYSKNKGIEIIKYFEPAPKHGKVSLKVFGGIFNSTFSTKIDIPSNIGYTFGIGLNEISPRRLQRFSWDQEILFYNEKVNYNYTNVETVILSYNYFCDLDLYYAKFNFLGKYHIDYGNFKPYFHAGISVATLFAYKGEKNETKTFGATTTVTDEKVGQIALGIVGGIGASYNKLSLELRYEKAGSASSISANNIYVLVGFDLISIKN